MEHVSQWLDQFLGTPGALRAVVVGLLLSWSATQALKFLPRLRALTPSSKRLMVRGMSFVFAAAPVFLMWPGPWLPRLFGALVTGLCAPTAYTCTVRIVYHFWPWLELKLSASPKKPKGAK